MSPVTIHAHLAEKRGTTGFDYLRIGLATAVVLWHSFPISYGQWAYDTALGLPVRALISLILFMFFALSGFLVAGSLERNRLPAFLSLRALRIFPALTVEVLLSALVLGPFLTTLPIAQYFSDHLFFRYILNAVGIISFRLPEVFHTNPYPAVVNGSLWTVPYELECYIALALVALLGFVRRPRLFLCLCLVGAALLTAYFVAMDKPQQISSGRALVFSFMIGVLIYVWRAHIPLLRSLAAVSALLCLIMLQRSELFYFACFPAAYLTVYIGLQNWSVPALMRTGDYSYGIYLFAFPIQQVVASWPMLQKWWINFPISLLFCLLYAVFSWHAIEAPLMRRKRAVVELVNRAQDQFERNGRALVYLKSWFGRVSRSTVER
ncbi:acyltransferase family protein [Methylobacterium sp. ID0610]|uniref:acyltransferase family protein n=1 Tax=Methylobacterium carpenticola TaxID=3344827 RepID=UPI0036C691E1